MPNSELSSLSWYVRWVRWPSTKRIREYFTLYFPKCRAKWLPIHSQKTSAAIYPVRLCPTLQSSWTLCEIAVDISAWVGTSYWNREGKHGYCRRFFARPLLNSYTLSSPSDPKTFPGFGKKWKLDLSPLKIILGSEEFPKIFLLLRHLQSVEAYN